MFEGVKIASFIFLCVAQSLNARPRLLREKSGKQFHYTNIGDIATQDILQLADSTTPASNEINPEQINDPYDNNIESETMEYAKTATDSVSSYLDTPRDQEQNFVNLLKKHYQGTFPEYGKETKSDFSKNKELEDNLSVQPETVYFGHSDRYQGKSEKNEGTNDFPIPDEGELDKAATFDEGSNLMNSETLDGRKYRPATSPQVNSDSFDTEIFEDKITGTTKRPTHASTSQQTKQSMEDTLSEYDENGDNNANAGQLATESPLTTEDYEGLLSLSGKHDSSNDNSGDNIVTEKPGDKNKHVTDSMNDHVTEHETDEVEDHMTEHVTDQMSDEMDDNVIDEMTDEKNNNVKELEKLREKTDEEALWDAEEKLRQQLSRKKKNKQKHLKMAKNKKKVKEEHSEGILKDFDELQKHNRKSFEKHIKPNGNIQKEKEKDKGNTNAVQHKTKPGNHNKAGKQIKYVHTDDSQVAGDAILDFLDRLLEKDPKELKHDVLAMAKEMQREGNSNSGAPETSSTAVNDEEATNSDSSNTTIEDKPQVTTESPKPQLTTDSQNPQVTTESPKASTKPVETDNWISQLKNDIDDKNQENAIKYGGKHREGKQNELKKENEGTDDNYDDEEYERLHEGIQDIYPDHNWGQSTNTEQQDGEKGQKVEEDNTKKDVKEKEEDNFDYEEFKEEALKMHNEYRRRHNAVALTWSESLAKKANTLARKLLHATKSNFKRELEKHGENIAILPYSAENIAKKAVEKWYAEITKFSFTSPSIKPKTRDFTQIIWKKSEKFGMGFVDTADKKKTLVVALYSPAGNDEKKMRDNLNTVNDDPYADIKRTVVARNIY